jgi:hypothetical protein
VLPYFEGITYSRSVIKQITGSNTWIEGWETRNANRILVGKPLGKSTLWRTRRYEINIKMNLKELVH